jgi:hypothetical protein
VEAWVHPDFDDVPMIGDTSGSGDQSIAPIPIEEVRG